MPDGTIFKICPHCGQSVDVQASRCPSCGQGLTADGEGFAGYERYSEDNPINADDTISFKPVSGNGQPVTGRASGSPLNESEEEPGESDFDFDADLNPEPKTGKIISVIAGIILIAVVVTAIGFALRNRSQNATQNDPVAIAQEYFDNEDYQKAIDELERAIKDENVDEGTYALLAKAYEKSGDLRSAAETCLRGYESLDSEKLKTEAIERYLKLGNAAEKDGNTQTAIDYYNTILEKLDAENSAALYAMAQLEDKESMEADTAQGSSDEDSEAESEEETSAEITPPAVSDGDIHAGGVEEQDEVIATPTPTPTATPTPTVKPSATATPKTSTTPKTTATATPTTAPSPTPTPTPSPSPTPTYGLVSTFSIGGKTAELYNGTKTWWEARDLALSKGGHMASFSSEEEMNSIAEQAEAQGLLFVWLDAMVDADEALADPEGTWENAAWSTGEALTYTPWMDGEPSGDGESYLCMIQRDGSWYLNDVDNSVTAYDSGKMGYIIIYD